MNRLMHILAVTAIVFAGGPSVFAQGGYTVSGTVTDDLGPVIGATIIEQGTSNGTTTGPDGGFSLTVSGPSSPVVISCIGYESQIFEASAVPSTITMKEDSEYLDEAVVVGYGTVRKDDMTGSVAAVKADEINRGAVTSTQDMLKGKIAGVLVTPGDGGPGSGSRIRIRGAASLNASNDPLIIIDGVPIANGAGGGMSNPLDLLNPNDIESFSVLKDASAAAIYGSRASNGVIIITTKKGSGSRPQVTYSGSVSVMRNLKSVPVMSPDEVNEYYAETYPAGTETGNRIIALTGNQHTDWQSLIFRTAFATEHNLSMYGTYRSMMPYRVSAGYLGQQGTLQESSYDRFTADLTFNPSFLDKHLTFDISAKGVYSYSDYADSGAIGKAAFFNPTVAPYWYDSDGSIDYGTTNGFWNYGNGRGDKFSPNTLAGPSPLSMIYDNRNTSASYRLIGRAAVNYKVHGFEALSFNISGGMDITESDTYNGVNPGSFQAWSDTENLGTGQHSKGNDISRSLLFESYANFNETWGKHDLDVLAGYSWQNSFASTRSVSYFNVTDGCSYIYDGTSWVLLVQAGADGTDGVDGEKGEAGENGVSIIWLGSFASESEIENPIVMNAYYNSMDGCSYLYNGTQWVLLARGSSDVSIVWKGSFENSDVAELQEPSLYWAYYNTTDGCSYLYNGSEWTLLFSDVLNNTPDSVSNLTINYSSPNKKITLNWKNPSDEKFDHVVISCTKDGILILSGDFFR